MDTVLGVSMAPTAVRMVLVEGENADGVTVDQENFDLPDGDGSATFSAPDQVISAILGTREGAAEAGYQLLSTGVTSSDHMEASALRDALAARKLEKVMLVSAFLAAAALAQTVGNATGYAHTALLYVEPDTATLAVVDTADGSIADVHRETLPEDDDEALAKLAEMVSGAEALDAHPDGVFVVGFGVDIALIKPALEAATSLAVSAPEEPDMALARGAALASANAPLFASSTAALAYAQDPGTGAVDPYAVAPGYLAVADVPVGTDLGEEDLAYSAIAEDPGAYTEVANEEEFLDSDLRDQGEQPGSKPFLTAMSVLTIFVVGIVALVLSLAVSIRPHVAQRPNLGQNVVAPTKRAPPPVPAKAQVQAPPAPSAPPAPAPAAAPLTVAPRAPASAAAPARAPAPAPIQLPAPAPPPPPPPVPPILPQLGQILAPPVQGPPVQPWGGDHSGGGWRRGDTVGGNQVIIGGLGIPGLHLGVGF